MPEEGQKPRIPFWGKAVIIGGIVFCLLGTFWVWLPNIVAFGLRYESTRETSKKTLQCLGPRAINEIFASSDYWSAFDGLMMLDDICDKAEEDPQNLNILVYSLKDLNARGLDGITLLHIAAIGNYVNLAERLLEAGAKVDIANDGSLHSRTGPTRCPRMTRYYKKHPHGSSEVTNYACKMTPLHFAAIGCSFKVGELLINNGAEINSTNSCGENPLYLAVGAGCLELAQLFLENGADANARNWTGQVPLHEAVLWARPEFVQMLLDNDADVYAKDNSGRTPLELEPWAGRENRTEAAKEIIRQHIAKNAEEEAADN